MLAGPVNIIAFCRLNGYYIKLSLCHKLGRLGIFFVAWA
jgi:hypothetical protein